MAALGSAEAEAGDAVGPGLDLVQQGEGILLAAVPVGTDQQAGADAQLHVTREDFYAYTVIEGDVTLTPVAAAPDDATADELVEVYRQISGGEHDEWDEYRRAMVADQRVVLRIRPTRPYGMIRPTANST